MSRPDARALARRASGAATTVGTIAALVLAPKCPLCVAAWLSALGIGAAGAGLLAPWVRPVGFAVAAAGVVALAWAEWRWLRERRRVQARRGGGCC